MTVESKAVNTAVPAYRAVAAVTPPWAAMAEVMTGSNKRPYSVSSSTQATPCRMLFRAGLSIKTPTATTPPSSMTGDLSSATADRTPVSIAAARTPSAPAIA